MKYTIKWLGILYLLLALFCFIFMWFKDGQEQTNYLILGVLFMLSFQAHMLEHTILNNVIRPNHMTVNLNGETVIETKPKEVD